MTMSSYEVVRRAIEFAGPDRLPLRLGALGLSVTHSVNWNQIGTGDHAQRETLDEWGCSSNYPPFIPLYPTAFPHPARDPFSRRVASQP